MPTLIVDANSGLVAPALQRRSPNQDLRPDAKDISLIVVHCISLPPGSYGGGEIEAFFANKLDVAAHPYFKQIQSMQVSAHVLIDRQGGVTQFVPFHRRAWHAGASSYGGREACNDYSIGIELEGTDDSEFDPLQYASLNALITALNTVYGAGESLPVVGHSDIAPGRKTDPGEKFDWSQLKP
ncbi:MAG: 1,6-anhydro-N-acetylmuramyl-L-alanine amidase AmpD [Pseudomonadota bacterium]